MSRTLLIWDLGGTKCGAAKVVTEADKLVCEQHVALHLKNYDTIDELIDHIESLLNVRHDSADKILIAGAGTFNAGTLELENPYPFKMDFARIADERDWPEFKVVHDYLPVLCSTFLPEIKDKQHVVPILPGKSDPLGRHVVFGVGTGLGLKDGVLLPDGQFWAGNNEMGHVGITFPPLAKSYEQERHEDFMEFLRGSTHHGAITFETILSGQGLALVHQYCDEDSDALTAKRVSALLMNGEAEDTAAMFAWYLGLFVGCVQLAFMPTGGLWMTGGVLKKNPLLAWHPELKKGIHAHPAYDKVRANFPLNLIVSDELTYLGGAWCAHKLF